MRYSIGSDDLIWLLRVAGENGSPHTLKEILGDVKPIVEPVEVAPFRDLTDEEVAEIDAMPVPPAKPE